MILSPPYDSRVVANSFLELGAESLVPITPMKLQKLVYFADGWNRTLNGRPLVADAVEAWPFGPVYPTLYHEFKQFGGQPIDSFYRSIDFNSFDISIPQVESDQEKNVVRRVWDSYGHLSANNLSARTHQTGTPWDLTIKGQGAGSAINPALIEQEFKRLLDSQGATA